MLIWCPPSFNDCGAGWMVRIRGDWAGASAAEYTALHRAGRHGAFGIGGVFRFDLSIGLACSLQLCEEE